MATEEEIQRFQEFLTRRAAETGRTERQVMDDIMYEVEHQDELAVKRIAQVLRDNGVDPTQYIKDNSPGGEIYEQLRKSRP